MYEHLSTGDLGKMKRQAQAELRHVRSLTAAERDMLTEMIDDLAGAMDARTETPATLTR